MDFTFGGDYFAGNKMDFSCWFCAASLCFSQMDRILLPRMRRNKSSKSSAKRWCHRLFLLSSCGALRSCFIWMVHAFAHRWVFVKRQASYQYALYRKVFIWGCFYYSYTMDFEEWCENNMGNWPDINRQFPVKIHLTYAYIKLPPLSVSGCWKNSGGSWNSSKSS